MTPSTCLTLPASAVPAQNPISSRLCLLELLPLHAVVVVLWALGKIVDTLLAVRRRRSAGKSRCSTSAACLVRVMVRPLRRLLFGLRVRAHS